MIRPGQTNVKRALIFAIGFCSAVFLLAFGVSRAPLSDETRETLIMAILWPLLSVMHAATGVVDSLGPKGRAEPASMYLPQWAGWVILVMSLLFLAASLFSGAFIALSWWGKRQAPHTPGG